MTALRCRHPFEYAWMHANGDVVCSIIDDLGDFVLGNVHEQSLAEVFNSDRPASCDAWCSRRRTPPARRSGRCAKEHRLTIDFDFAHTWGRSRRQAWDLEYLRPHLKPFTALPGESRWGGW